MAAFVRPDGVDRTEFVDANLRGARFVRTDLSGVVMRAVEVQEADIDAPWLFEGDSFLRINGVDVIPLIEAELNRRFPGRADRRAADPEGLRAAWAGLEHTWAATLSRVATMPVGTTDVSVDGEWSFSQTLRHLVMATDTWLRRAIQEVAHPFHPIGQPNSEYETDGNDMSVFSVDAPSFAKVLQIRAGRVAWCATSSPPSHRKNWRLLAKTRGPPNIRKPSSRACTRSFRRSGSTTAMRYAI